MAHWAIYVALHLPSHPSPDWPHLRDDLVQELLMRHAPEWAADSTRRHFLLQKLQLPAAWLDQSLAQWAHYCQDDSGRPSTLHTPAASGLARSILAAVQPGCNETVAFTAAQRAPCRCIASHLLPVPGWAFFAYNQPAILVCLQLQHYPLLAVCRSVCTGDATCMPATAGNKPIRHQRRCPNAGKLEHLLEAELWSEAHQLLCLRLAPQLFVASYSQDDLAPTEQQQQLESQLQGFLSHMNTHRHQLAASATALTQLEADWYIPGWAEGAGVYSTYYSLRVRFSCGQLVEGLPLHPSETWAACVCGVECQTDANADNAGA